MCWEIQAQRLSLQANLSLVSLMRTDKFFHRQAWNGWQTARFRSSVVSTRTFQALISSKMYGEWVTSRSSSGCAWTAGGKVCRSLEKWYARRSFAECEYQSGR